MTDPPEDRGGSSPPVPVRRLSAWASGSVAVAAGLMLGNVAGYALALVAARQLGADGFGELSALLAIVVVLAVLPTGLQTVVARAIAGHEAHRTLALGRGRLAGVAALAAVAIAPAVLAVGVLIGADPRASALTAATLAPLLVLGWSQGVLQGREHLGRLGALLLLNNGGRALGAVVGVLVAGTPTAALAGSLLAGLAAASIGLVLAGAVNGAEGGRGVRDVLLASGALLALFACTNVDVVLARATLDGDTAGAYAVGAVVAKVAFWLPQFVAVTALPRLVDPRRRDLALRVSVSLVLALGAGVTVGCALAAPLVLEVVSGGGYALPPDQLWVFGAVGTLWSLSQVLLYDALARRVPAPASPLWIAWAALLVVVLLTRPDGTLSLAFTALAASIVALAGYAWRLTTRAPGRPPATVLA